MNPLIEQFKRDMESDGEHLKRDGVRWSTEESAWDGFCPRCLMSEEEASQNPCKKPKWLIEEASQSLINLITKMIEEYEKDGATTSLQEFKSFLEKELSTECV